MACGWPPEAIFVEQVLPTEVLRGLTKAEMAGYRRPYLRPGEDRRPTLSWPRQVPVAGEPLEVAEVVERYAAWLAESPVPTLFVQAVPGVMFESHRAVARAWPNQQHVSVRAGHVVPEDVPDELGTAIAAWLRTLP